jgi:hypothetical protein
VRWPWSFCCNTFGRMSYRSPATTGCAGGVVRERHCGAHSRAKVPGNDARTAFCQTKSDANDKRGNVTLSRCAALPRRGFPVVCYCLRHSFIRAWSYNCALPKNEKGGKSISASNNRLFISHRALRGATVEEYSVASLK